MSAPVVTNTLTVSLKFYFGMVWCSCYIRTCSVFTSSNSDTQTCKYLTRKLFTRLFITNLMINFLNNYLLCLGFLQHHTTLQQRAIMPVIQKHHRGSYGGQNVADASCHMKALYTITSSKWAHALK